MLEYESRQMTNKRVQVRGKLIFHVCRLNKLMDYEANNEKIYFNLGMLSMDEGKFHEAEKYFIKAIRVSCNAALNSWPSSVIWL